MRMFYKSVNMSEVVYNVLDAPGVLTQKFVIIPRKLSIAAAARIVKKIEGDHLIQQTLTVRGYKTLYRMPMELFLKHAERVESQEPITEDRGPA